VCWCYDRQKLSSPKLANGYVRSCLFWSALKYLYEFVLCTYNVHMKLLSEFNNRDVWITGWMSEFRFTAGTGNFTLHLESWPALGPTQPPTHCVLWALFPGVTRKGSEADHSPPSSAVVKNTWSCTSTPSVRLHGVVVKRRDSFIFLLHRNL
jgi:hypothetical protein